MECRKFCSKKFHNLYCSRTFVMSSMIQSRKTSRHVAWVGVMGNAHKNFLKDLKDRGCLDNAQVINNCMHWSSSWKASSHMVHENIPHILWSWNFTICLKERAMDVTGRNNSERNCKEIVCEVVDWVNLAQYRIPYQAVINMVMNSWSHKRQECLDYWISYSRRFLCHELVRNCLLDKLCVL